MAPDVRPVPRWVLAKAAQYFPQTRRLERRWRRPLSHDDGRACLGQTGRGRQPQASACANGRPCRAARSARGRSRDSRGSSASRRPWRRRRTRARTSSVSSMRLLHGIRRTRDGRLYAGRSLCTWRLAVAACTRRPPECSARLGTAVAADTDAACGAGGR